MKDILWAELFTEDCNQALFLFMKRYGEKLKRQIRKKYGDYRDAEECYYDTLYELCLHGRECKTNGIYAYALGIARYRIAGFYARAEKDKKLVEYRSYEEYEMQGNLCPEETLGETEKNADKMIFEERDIQLDLELALQREKPRNARIFRYYLASYKIMEIAQKMDLTEGQVQMTISRMKKRLRKDLKDYEF